MFPSLLSKPVLIPGMLTLAATLAAINPGVRLKHEENQRQFTVEIGPVDLPGTGSGHVQHGGSGQHAHTNAVTPPVSEVRIPIEGFVNGFRVSIADSAGKPVPSDLIHHLNFIDPENRELFLPISQRMLAVGKETGSHSFPRMLFGYPVRKAQPMIVSAMLHNPHAEDFSGVTVRVTFTYTPTRRLWPLFRVYPFQLDVLFPHGDKSFDLPPGRSERSFDASPVIPGRIVVMSGHVHEYAESLTMSDVTTGTVIWVGRPKLDTNGKVSGMPVANFASRLGVKLRPDHRYRVTVVYNNPTLDTLVAGGMGVVGGLFMPQLTARWPKADPTDTAYGIDRTHYLQLTRGVR